ncbi:RNA polymerase sigma factor [Alicyclobacillus dauci]|uniref:Uncharacterized protein n=1 Tax=Alicyclobacillus dauci TaxID=1475485 RepID=A0ABY6YYG4_9BACL|nr:hypothetical protein [Alicyclobacillus dauci]WAH35021.1 hypothetical protein NZD86_11845 [Alicyclobacillus dauci]
MNEKYCPCCNRTLPIEEFQRNRARKDGYQSECRKCRKMYDSRVVSYNRVMMGKKTYEEVLAAKEAQTDESYDRVISALRIWIEDKTLTPAQAESIYLHAVERFSFREIGALVGTHYSNAIHHYNKGIARLREKYLCMANEVYGVSA